MILKTHLTGDDETMDEGRRKVTKEEGGGAHLGVPKKVSVNLISIFFS
jgi:hypothetical protein